MPQRPSAARLRPLLIALAVAAPAATALAVAETPPPTVAPATTPSHVIGEQVGTARQIVPFGAAREDGDVVTFAVGRTRAPSPEPPVSTTTPRLVPAPPGQNPDGDPDGETAGQRAQAPAPSTPNADSVLLVGKTAGATAPTAWSRAAAPLDAAGEPLKPGSWYPAGAATDDSQASSLAPTPQHAGESTQNGAAALLVATAPDGGAATSGLLVRTAADAFRLLPPPPAALLAPAAELSAPDAKTDVAPFATFDVAPPATGPAPTYGRTGVLIAPPGGDGVLVWDGSAWSEEPFQNAAGVAEQPTRSPSALGATADGDGVALVAGADGTAADRITLYRRLADRSGWRPVVVDSPLVSGALPDGVSSVLAVPRPGDPLTVTAGHWWLDLLVANADGAEIAATVHLTPGVASTTPATGTSPTSDTSPTTAPTDPPATDPPPTTTTAPTTPATTAPTTPAVLRAKATRTWCQSLSSTGPVVPALPDPALCDDELPGKFSLDRGYRSIAFAGQGLLPDGAAPTTPSTDSPYGGRVITSPVMDVVGDSAAVRDSSASGGYLRLDGPHFTLRGGIGESPQADNLTQTAAFISDRLGWTGGRRVIGHVTTASDPDAGTFLTTTPVSFEPVLDVALSPQVEADRGAGAVVLSSGGIRRVYDDGRSTDYGGSLYSVLIGQTPRTPRAIAWPFDDVVVVVGTNGLLATLPAPVPRSGFDEGDVEDPELEEAAAGLDLTDVAFQDAREFAGEADLVKGFGGWAVGRDGAALHFDRDDITRVELPASLDKPDLRQVIYAGQRAYVASSAGLLVEVNRGTEAAPDFTLEPDAELGALMTADGRGSNVFTVAGLRDGTLVVDGRYVRLGTGGSWERLASPAEGDVVALSVMRKPGAAPGVAGLSIFAAIADRPRPRTGETQDRMGPPPPPGPEGGTEEDPATLRVERTPVAEDGRLTELTSAGWIDRTRTPLDLGNQLDVPVPDVPTQAIASDDTGRGWAVSGTAGSFDDDFETMFRIPRGAVLPLGVPRADAAAAVPSAVVGHAATGTRAQTTPAPTTPSPTTPADAPPVPAIEPAGPGSPPVRILVGGHPACLSSCTGRADQRLAPTENLREAVATARRMHRDLGEQSARALIVGGGRTSFPGPIFDRAAAHDYRDLLVGEANGVPVFPAIGSGDQAFEESRATFAADVARPLRPTAARATTDGIVPVTDPAPPGGDTVAYAFDVVGSGGGAARVVVADTADAFSVDETTGDPIRTPRDWTAGAHGEWLAAVLDDAAAKGRPSVVIGAAAVERRAPTAKTEFLATHGASAYVSTDGSDDPYDVGFGPRERRGTLNIAGRELLLLHTSTLGHAMPQATLNRNRDVLRSAGPNDGPLADLTSSASLLELTIPTERDSLRQVVPRSVPVFRRFAAPESRPMPVGAASGAYLPTAVENDNGVRYTDKLNPDPNAPAVAAWGFGQGDATPYPCRTWFSAEDCGERVDSSGRFEVADPSIAVFARARFNPKAKNQPPEIIVDARGNPIQDASSPVLCPLKPGTTTATAAVSGRTVSFPIRVVDRPANADATGKKCEFMWGSPNEPKKDPEPAKPPVNPAVRLPNVVAAVQPDPKPLPKPTNSPQPPVQPMSALPVVAPVFAIPTPSAQEPTPTVAPNPKPFTTPPTPTPPSGVNSHAYLQAPSPMMQFQVATAMQQQRREQLARESAEHHATIYRAEPRSPLAPALAGGAALALLVGAAGHAAGRRRALSRAAQRRWIG